MGAYHGRTGFDAFSHQKTVVKRPFALDMKLRYPPYGGRAASSSGSCDGLEARHTPDGAQSVFRYSMRPSLAVGERLGEVMSAVAESVEVRIEIIRERICFWVMGGGDWYASEL